jgi:hypothetical protein
MLAEAGRGERSDNAWLVESDIHNQGGMGGAFLWWVQQTASLVLPKMARRGEYRATK